MRKSTNGDNMKVYEITLTNGQQLIVDYAAVEPMANLLKIGEHYFSTAVVAAIVSRELEQTPEEEKVNEGA